MVALEWIKMRHGLHDDPDVVYIASLAGIDEHAAVGRLHWFWQTADQQTTDGVLAGWTPETLDRKVACPGFAQAMATAKWLKIVTAEESIDGRPRLVIPKFDVHISESAKKRAKEQAKKQRQRGQSGDKSGTDWGQGGDKCPPEEGTKAGHEGDTNGTETGPQNKKKNKNIKTPPTPPRGESEKSKKAKKAFQEFSGIYPRKEALDAAEPAFCRLALKTIPEVIQAAKNYRDWFDQSDQELRYVPYPQKFINKSLWKDWQHGVPDSHRTRDGPHTTRCATPDEINREREQRRQG